MLYAWLIVAKRVAKYLLHGAIVMGLWAMGASSMRMLNLPSDLFFYGGVGLGLITIALTVTYVSEIVSKLTKQDTIERKEV